MNSTLVSKNPLQILIGLSPPINFAAFVPRPIWELTSQY